MLHRFRQQNKNTVLTAETKYLMLHAGYIFVEHTSRLTTNREWQCAEVLRWKNNKTVLKTLKKARS